MCDYHCSPNTLTIFRKKTKAILLDFITLAFVLEYVQWQPRIQGLTQKCKPNFRKRYLFETNLHITNFFNSLILTNEKSYLDNWLPLQLTLRKNTPPSLLSDKTLLMKTLIYLFLLIF